VAMTEDTDVLRQLSSYPEASECFAARQEMGLRYLNLVPTRTKMSMDAFYLSPEATIRSS
jgi:hypothetical protein